MTSIRRHLLIALSAAILLGLVGGAIGTYRIARQEAGELFDYHLRQLALSLRDQSFSNNAPRPGLADGLDDHDFVIQVWDLDGVPVYHSDPSRELPRQPHEGFATVDTPTGRWRVFTARMHDQYVQVAHPRHVRDRLAATMAARMLLPLLLVTPILALLIGWIVGRGLAPLDRIAASVARRAPGALQPLARNGVPTEAVPLVDALNDLLVRLEQALAAQRTFVADAAHELRTPLTALQLHLQLARRAPEDQRTEAFEELRGGLERASHVVQQLLTLARQEPGARDNQPAVTIELAPLAAQVVADHLRLAESRGIDLGIADADGSAQVEGHAEALRTLIANLVDNALRYTPAGGRVDVATRRADGATLLEVTDSGPGIPPDERERVLDRFYRRAGTGESGSGLGLAIVKAIADRHGASVHLEEARLGGLAVVVRWPAARQD
jgi:two-component system OmpR family sensor kinase